AVLLVHMPKAVADHFIGDRVDLFCALSMQFELGRDGKLLRRHVASVPAVEDCVLHFAHFGHELPLVFPSSLARRGGSEADGVVRPLALHHPPPAADPSSCQEGGKSIRSHRPKEISKLPNASTRSDRPGCTTTVVSGVSITAGPLMRFPGASSAPS